MRKLLNTLYITNEQAYLMLDGENIVCKVKEAETFRIPFGNIESIFCFSYIGCSPAFMGKCADSGVALNFFSPYGKFLARVVGATKGNVLLRKQQIEKFEDKKINLVQNTVAAKLSNSRTILKKALHDHPDIDEDNKISEFITYLSNAIRQVYSSDDIDTIRGIEGFCAKGYFDCFNLLILQPDDFEMQERTKRPPLDRTNALLSFLYAMYTCDCASALEAAGLDSYIGYYHSLRPGRCSLACDLVEEIRCLAERMVLTLINLKIVSKKDFDVEVTGATFLNDEGRKKVLSFWQEKKRTQLMHWHLKEKIPFGLLPFVQANLLAKFVRGDIDEYPSFILK